MGMYDEISCKRQMPDGFRGYNYQSKDLECTLDEYKVTSKGRLVRTFSTHYPDGEFRPLGDLDYSGSLNIYTSTSDDCSDWHEYDLLFENGSLIRIEPVI